MSRSATTTSASARSPASRLPCAQRHLALAEDLAEALRRLPAAGDREGAARDRGASRELAGGHRGEGALVGGHHDIRIFGTAVMNVDRAVVDGEVKGRIADQVLIGVMDAR